MVNAGTEPESAPFFRQRRNLIIISVVLLFLESSSVDFGNAKAFDIELVFKHPEVVPIALWIAGFYWLLRYYQYFRKTEYLGLRKRWRDELYQVLRIVAPAKARKEQPNLFQTPRDIPNGKTIVKGISLSLNQHRLRDVSVDIDFGVTTESPDGTEVQAGGTPGVRLEFSYGELVVPRIRAAWRLLVHTPEGTQYFLPPLLFGCACSIKLWQWIGPMLE
jgi:hypothetical protein